MPNPDRILLVQTCATLFLTGVIWFVQVVHYPLFATVDRARFRDYHARHTRRTTWVVAPPMLLEAAAAIAWPFTGTVPAWQSWGGLALVALIWLSTAALQVPQHRRLERGFDDRAHLRLVATNRIRVAAWSARSLLVLGWWL